MANQAGTTLHGYDRCPEYSEFFSSDTFRPVDSEQTSTAAEQVRPDGLGMICQEHRIRELVAVRMARRVVVE